MDVCGKACSHENVPAACYQLWDSSLLGPGSRDGLRHPENAQRKQPQSVQKGLTRRRGSQAAVQELKSLPQLRNGPGITSRSSRNQDQVVARSPDLATWPTEGLQPQARRETYGPADGGVWRPAEPPSPAGDLRSSRRRGLETRAEPPSPAGDLRSSRRRGLETRAEPPADGGVWRPRRRTRRTYGPADGGVWRPAPNRQQTAGSGDPRPPADGGVWRPAEPPADGGVWRPAPNRQQTAGSGDPRRTASRRRGLETRAESPTYGPVDGGVWRPAPNRQLEIRKLFPARS